MSAKAIREFDGKAMLFKWLKANTEAGTMTLPDVGLITPSTDINVFHQENPWVNTTKLVAKPDQLIKRRGKAGLLKLNATWEQAKEWINERRGKEQKVEVVTGVLDHFIVEPFVPHAQEDEYYICIVSKREGDEILFHHEGGVDVGDVDAKAVRTLITAEGLKDESQILTLIAKVPVERQPFLAEFITKLYTFYKAMFFTYLEINPLVVTAENLVVPLDMAAKIDECAKFEVHSAWGPISFPPPFGRPPIPEEQFIKDMDAKTGASLKLTVLNPKGRVWTMVAGGGASVIYADTLTDLGFGSELANYGEYSGAPNTQQTYSYAKTIFGLMTREVDSRGKVLVVGGGIANFTDVAATFKGLIKALREFADIFNAQNIKVFVRRGGPNYQEGLSLLRSAGAELSLDMKVFGPDRHMTEICSLALGLAIDEEPEVVVTRSDTRSSLSMSAPPAMSPATIERKKSLPISETQAQDRAKMPFDLFTKHTRALIYGLQLGAVQNMLDFDYICGREKPSVAGLVYPFKPSHFQKFYWSTAETLLPVHQDMKTAVEKNPDVDVMVNFASFRSVYESTLEILKYPQIKTIAIIAEGVPERRAREIIELAASKGVTIIGPATVGGIKPGCFRIGNTGGMLDNIVSSKLYRPGSVAYVARSGGMSNEMNNIINRNADGVYEGIAIGGDRYPGTTFVDHLLRYEQNPDIKMLVVLGEVGGVEEYEIGRLIKEGKITKPMVAWCIGTCAKIFPYEVQFGHAGACAQGKTETADAKNLMLKLLGVVVPDSFEDFGRAINSVYTRLVAEGTIIETAEKAPPTIPVDYAWARKLGLIRKPSAFISSIVDERGEELVYAGMKISEVFQSNLGVGGVLGLIWFRRKLPDYFCRFIEMVLMVTADHGPAVSGAHNTIVCARAGKDLVSSLCSGLLTIGPRFGGALDAAAEQFSSANDKGMSAQEFVSTMRKKKQLIMGIGHKVKSLENPDARVTIVKKFVRRHFKSTDCLDFACEVEKVCTKKKSNLILNVDGAIAVAFVDLLRTCGAFTQEEANEYIKMKVLNGLFVVGRSIGFVGHWIDQKRLKQGLYRHPTEDISYLVNHNLSM